MKPGYYWMKLPDKGWQIVECYEFDWRPGQPYVREFGHYDGMQLFAWERMGAEFKGPIDPPT